MKTKIMAGVVVLVAAAGAAAGWYYYTSPEYSLIQMVKAIEQRDAGAFEQYVDLEGIIRRAGNQLSSEWSAGFSREVGGLGSMEPEVVNSMIAAFGSAMIEPTVKQVREAILSFVETGRASPIQSLPGDAVDIAADLKIESHPLVERQGKMATVDLTLGAEGETARVRLFMRSKGSYWQIAEIDQVTKSAREVLAAYARGERKRVERERMEHPDEWVTIDLDGTRTQFMAMSYIPAGKFMMGSPKDENKRGEDEGPRRRVKISQPFWMGKTEVTNGQFAAFMKATGYVTTAEKAGSSTAWDTEKRAWGMVKGASWRNTGLLYEHVLPAGTTFTNKPPDDHPVVLVSWEDADAFCKWLSQETGQAFSLPTEAQWEYACRAGTNATWFWGNRESEACEFANVWNQEYKGRMNLNWDGFPCADGHLHTAPAASFKPNPWGLHDITGNVWEWTADWYGGNYYAEAPESDPPGPATGEYRVLRGGSWNGNGTSRARQTASTTPRTTATTSSACVFRGHRNLYLLSLYPLSSAKRWRKIS